MSYLIPISEFFQYVLFSILIGHVVLQFVPEAKKPVIMIRKPVLLLCTIGIPLCTFAPLIELIIYFKNSAGIYSATIAVLTDFQIGRAWLFIFFLSILLWMTIYVGGAKFFQAQWLLLMIFAIGNASHAASLSFWEGVFSHSAHFLMVTIWVGVLMNVGLFSKNRANWSSFLKWFTPLALICFSIILISGFLLMNLVLNGGSYLNSWSVPYGRILLLKHISVIPVLTFATINGLLSRKAIKQPSFNPLPWIRVECFLLLIVFYCTGVLGTLPPPHKGGLGSFVSSGPEVTWVDWLFAKNIYPVSQLEFAPTVSSILLMVISLLFLLLILFSFIKLSKVFAVIFGGCFIITIYLGLLFSVNYTMVSY